MLDYRGLQDVYFIALYWGVALLAGAACLYLLFRRRNVFMREDAPQGEPPRAGLMMRSSLRLRRWTAALMAAMAASHVWWYAVGMYWLADDWLVRTILVIMFDYATLVPLTMGVLLAMLQDHCRPLWPWLVVQLPVVMFAVAGIDSRDWTMGNDLPHYYQLAVIAAFVVYYIFAVRRYGRWLLDNYADLDCKEVWQSLVFAMALFAIYIIYTSNAGELTREYLSQVISIAIIAFMLWRVETLQELEEN